MGLHVEHRQHKGLNNRVENSHQPTRQRERIMNASSHADRRNGFSVHDQVANLFHVPYPEKATDEERRTTRDRAFAVWRNISKTSLAI